MKKLTISVILIIIMTACNNVNSDENQSNDKQLNADKDTIDWANQKVCFDNLEKYEVDSIEWQHIKYDFFNNNSNNRIYYLTCENERGPVWHLLSFNIDFETYQDLGRYAVDRYYVYFRFTMSDGDKIYKLDTADRKTFKALGKSTYAKDKNHVYRRGDIMVNADVKTFEVIDFETNIPIAKDKNHVYIWDEILQDTTIIEGLKEYLEK